MKRLYRAPLDWVEMAATGSADVVVANSNFTAGVYQQAFPNLPGRPKVVYPAADFDSFTPPDWAAKTKTRGGLRATPSIDTAHLLLTHHRLQGPLCH